MRKWNDNSIRLQLLYWLLLPLCFLCLITTTIAYFLAVSFANNAYDQALLNSADSVMARLRYDGNKVWVDLPPAAQEILRHHDRDKFYYQVITKDGKRISGDIVLHGPFPQLESQEPVFRYATVNSQNVRIARIRVDVPNYPDQTVLIQVAETLNSRHQLAGQILLSIVVPQIMLIILGSLTVSFGVGRGLAPLTILERALAKRSQSDLTPVAEHNTPIEVRPLVNAVNDLLNRLRMDIELQQRFVANAAHQLRTPLAGLKTYIYAAKRLPSDKRMSEVLEHIDAGTDRMSRLANQLLALAKAEPSNKIEQYSQLDLNFAVSQVTAEFAGKAVTKGIELTFEGSPAPAFINGNSTNLIELITNLIENSILYTQPGGNVAVRITNGSSVILTVQDTGPGIPQEEQELVFERFYRVLGTEVPGSGLGLSIVKEIALAHNAKISLASNNEIGTTMMIAFPSVNNNHE